jgi:4-hydroxybenzoate polyprenyltransferase
MIRRLLTTLHLLDLDIVLGVIAGGLLARHATHTTLPAPWFVVVPLTAWIVYVVDRLADNARRDDDASTLRHAFHARHRKPLTVAVALAALVLTGIVATTPLPSAMWHAAGGGVLMVAMHQALQRMGPRAWRGLFKDANVVLTYTFAIWATPLGLTQSMEYTWILACLAHLLVVIVIVIEESLADVDVDTRHDDPSIARSVGHSALRRAAHLCALAATACGIAVTLHDHLLGGVIIAMSAAAAALPRVFRAALPLPVRRACAELVLSIPFILLVQNVDVPI